MSLSKVTELDGTVNGTSTLGIGIAAGVNEDLK